MKWLLNVCAGNKVTGITVDDDSVFVDVAALLERSNCLKILLERGAYTTVSILQVALMV